jgi:hypothetical protein
MSTFKYKLESPSSTGAQQDTVQEAFQQALQKARQQAHQKDLVQPAIQHSEHKSGSFFIQATVDSSRFAYENSSEIIRSHNITYKYYTVNQVRLLFCPL